MDDDDRCDSTTDDGAHGPVHCELTLGHHGPHQWIDPDGRGIGWNSIPAQVSFAETTVVSYPTAGGLKVSINLSREDLDILTRRGAVDIPIRGDRNVTNLAIYL